MIPGWASLLSPRVSLSWSNLDLIVTFSNFCTKMLTFGRTEGLPDFPCKHFQGPSGTTRLVVFPPTQGNDFRGGTVRL